VNGGSRYPTVTLWQSWSTSRNTAGEGLNPEGWSLKAGIGRSSILSTVLPPVCDSLDEATAGGVRQLERHRRPTGT
jgi:hypothetical protein